MQLEHSFEVPVPVDDAWNILLDVERVAPCMPGATLDTVDGDEFRGKVKVKVGPIQVTYTGQARFVDRDDASHQVTIEASGKEVRGSGTAKASVRAALASVTAERTRVDVLTDLAITGRPAQFGRGVMVDVGGKIIGQFARCLEQLIESSGAAEAPADDLLAGEVGPGAPDTVAAAVDAPAADASSAAAGADRAAEVDTVSAVVDGPATEGVSDGATAGASSPLTRAGSADAGASAAAVNAVGAAAGAAAAPGAVSTGAASGAAAASAAPERPTPRPAPPQAAEAIDLLDAAGGPILKRVGPPLAGVALLLLLLRRWRKRRSS